LSVIKNIFIVSGRELIKFSYSESLIVWLTPKRECDGAAVGEDETETEETVEGEGESDGEGEADDARDASIRRSRSVWRTWIAAW
jgi:hypothetical protein